METVDAVVIGAGHNGLVAANLLADEGWSVLVLEATADAGGAVRSAELTVPGFRHDVFSAFYPLAVASPVLRALELESYGLQWAYAPEVFAHLVADDHAVVLNRDRERTAASVAEFDPADGPAWLRACEEWDAVGAGVLDALFTPFPPVRPMARLAAALGPGGLLRLARRGAQPLRNWVCEDFSGEGARCLLAGAAMHSDLGPNDVGSAVFGWVLCMLGQQYGFPVPVGGAGRLADALVARLRARGGHIRTGCPVTGVVVRDGLALGVRTLGGEAVRARRAVLADVAAPLLYEELVGPEHLPARFRAALGRFQWDLTAVKLDWALSGPVPWRAPELARTGVVHLGGDLAELTATAEDLRAGRPPRGLYAVLGQMNVADPSRSPSGTATAWAYTHLPHERHDDPDAEAYAVEQLETTMERVAPGFRDLVVGRNVLGPKEIAAANPNLVRGTMNGGTAAVHQQLVFRPVPGLGRADTPVRRLFLAGSSAHPGGGVHGACGANAARAALAATGPAGAAYRGAMSTLNRALYGT